MTIESLITLLISYFSQKNNLGSQNNQFLTQLKKPTINRANFKPTIRLTKTFKIDLYQNVIGGLTDLIDN